MSKKSYLGLALVLGLLIAATAVWAQGPPWERGYGMGYGPGPGGGYGMMGYGPGPGGGYGMMGYGPGFGGGYGMMGYGPGFGGGYGMMGYGPGPGRGYGMRGYGPADCPGWGYGPGETDQSPDPEFLEENSQVRQEIFQKRAELRAVLAAETPDEAKATSLQQEINKLHDDMAMKRLEAILAARKTKAAN